MPSKKQLEEKVGELEERTSDEFGRKQKNNVKRALEELQEEMDGEDLNVFTKYEKFENMSIEEMKDYLEYREEHLEDEEEDDSPEEITFEEAMEETKDELEKKQKLEGIYEELEDANRLSVEVLKEKAEAEEIDNNFVVEWLEREGLLIEEFRKEVNTNA